MYQQNKRDSPVNIYVSVEVAGDVKMTAPAPTGSNDPVWINGGDEVSELKFNGGDEGLDPHTVVRVSVYHRRAILSDVFIGQWNEKLVNLATRSARKPNWYPLSWHTTGQTFGESVSRRRRNETTDLLILLSLFHSSSLTTNLFHFCFIRRYLYKDLEKFN